MIIKQHQKLYDKFIVKLSQDMGVDVNNLEKHVKSMKIQKMGLVGSYQPVIIEVEFSSGDVYLVGEDPNFEEGFSYAIKNF